MKRSKVRTAEIKLRISAPVLFLLPAALAAAAAAAAAGTCRTAGQFPHQHNLRRSETVFHVGCFFGGGQRFRGFRAALHFSTIAVGGGCFCVQQPCRRRVN
jgi:hypothetical protein